MSSFAKAHFLCGAKDCDIGYLTDLFNDGQYDSFIRPDGWHIQLGFNLEGSDTTVRCPKHCRFIGESISKGGYWEDDE